MIINGEKVQKGRLLLVPTEWNRTFANFLVLQQTRSWSNSIGNRIGLICAPALPPPLIYALQEPSHLFWPRVGYRASQEYLHSCFRSLAIPITDGSCRVFKWASRHSLLHKDALLLPHSNEMARRRERHLHFQCVCVWGCVCVWAHVWESGCVCVRVSNANRPHPKNMKSRLCSKTNWIKTTNHRRLLQWPIL